MTDGTPRLRAVAEELSGDPGVSPRAPDPASSADRGSGRGTLVLAIVLALLLAGSLGFAAWTRQTMGERITALEDDIFRLHGELQQRGRVIRAQQDRLGEVRTSVDELRELLERPLPDVSPLSR